MKILALDTSTATASLAVCDGGLPLAEAALAVGRRRGEHLPGAIAWLLGTLGLKPAEVEGFAVGLGPGSFTGLRAGLALVKGMALPNPRPLVGVSSLHALAAAAVGHRGPVLPVIDAHKGEVYAAVFETGSAAAAREGAGVEGPAQPISLPLRLSPDSALLPGRLPDLLSAAGVRPVADSIAPGPAPFSNVLVLGDGLLKHAAAIAAALPGAVFAPPLCWPPRAAWVAALAWLRLLACDTDPLDPLVPIYVRSSDTDLRLGPRA